MFRSTVSPQNKRLALKQALATGKTLRFPGAHNAMVGMIAQEIGFDGVYVSGGVMANNRGLPDVGLTTLDEVRVSNPAEGIPKIRLKRRVFPRMSASE